MDDRHRGKSHWLKHTLSIPAVKIQANSQAMFTQGCCVPLQHPQLPSPLPDLPLPSFLQSAGALLRTVLQFINDKHVCCSSVRAQRLCLQLLPAFDFLD